MISNPRSNLPLLVLDILVGVALVRGEGDLQQKTVHGNWGEVGGEPTCFFSRGSKIHTFEIDTSFLIPEIKPDHHLILKDISERAHSGTHHRGMKCCPL